MAEYIEALQEIGVDMLITGGHHRKLAIIDRQILYEGSLSILSQNNSYELCVAFARSEAQRRHPPSLVLIDRD